MASDEAVPSPDVAAAVDTDNDAKPTSKQGKRKAPGSKIKKQRKPQSYPSYLEMISDAIITLKERTGSSQYAIAKFLVGKHKELPPNFKKMLLYHLKKLVASGDVVKVKGSFKLPSGKPTAPVVLKKKPSPAVSTAKSVKTKPSAKPKSTKKPAVPVKAKTKAVIKPKPAPVKTKVVEKPKPVVKAKAARKVNPSTKERPSKVAKTAGKPTPGKSAAPSKILKKTAPVKKAVAKLRSVKSPAKKAAAAKKGAK